jgi:hypothetical protein
LRLAYRGFYLRHPLRFGITLQHGVQQVQAHIGLIEMINIHLCRAQ